MIAELRPMSTSIPKSSVVNPDDYYGEDGLLVCGRCHTRKQVRIEGSLFGGVKFCACKCVQDRMTREKERQKADEDIRVLQKMRKESLMDERLSHATFSEFREDNENAENLRKCKDYAERFPEMLEKNQGLIFCGECGTGKTFSAACIANYLLEQRVPVMMTSFIKLLDAIEKRDDDMTSIMSTMNRAKLLIIDDLGAERGTDYAIEKVYNIIDSRYGANLPLILTTNLSIEEMKSTEDTRYKRVYDRIFEMCLPISFTGKSWRKMDANRRFKDMKDFFGGK